MTINGGYVVRLHPVSLVVLFVVALVCARLGQWQLARADESERSASIREQRMAQAPRLIDGSEAGFDTLRYRRARVAGSFIEEEQVFLDSRKGPDGRLGYRVITPLRIQSSDHFLLVDRGWIGRDPNQQPAMAPAAKGVVELEGYLDAPVTPPIILGEAGRPSEAWGNVWPYPDIGLFERRLDATVLPFILNQEAPGPIIRKRSMHIGYAVQWFVFAIMALGLSVAMSVKRKSNDERLTQ